MQNHYVCTAGAFLVQVRRKNIYQNIHQEKYWLPRFILLLSVQTAILNGKTKTINGVLGFQPILFNPEPHTQTKPRITKIRKAEPNKNKQIK